MPTWPSSTSCARAAAGCSSAAPARIWARASSPESARASTSRTPNPEEDEAARAIDDIETPAITWPNDHSGRNGDAQPVETLGALHRLMARADGTPIAWLPALPHEGAVSAPAGSAARAIARGRSKLTGRGFHLAVTIERSSGGGPALAGSSFHHFADCNLDPRSGAPTFVVEPRGDTMLTDPATRRDADSYLRTIAA